jgi:hypothetical protein
MFTETGKKLATEQAAKTIAFFDDLLDDLESWGIASFERRTIILEEDFRTRDGASMQRMEVTIVMPRFRMRRLRLRRRNLLLPAGFRLTRSRRPCGPIRESPADRRQWATRSECSRERKNPLLEGSPQQPIRWQP